MDWKPPNVDENLDAWRFEPSESSRMSGARSMLQAWALMMFDLRQCVVSLAWWNHCEMTWAHAKRHSPKAVAGYDLLHVLSSLHLDILATHRNRLIADGTSLTRDQNYPLHHHESTKWATPKISTIWCGTQEFERWCSQSEIVMFGVHIACQEFMSDMCVYNLHSWSFLVHFCDYIKVYLIKMKTIDEQVLSW